MRHPEQLGKYAITGLLGEGAMGVVYKGFDPGIGRHVAIKTIRKSASADRSAQDALSERFRNEARAVGRLNHPGIVAIYDLGEHEDNAFIAMEYVQGRDLSQILAATPDLPEPVILRVMHQLLDALEYAHGQGVWHRDIKPANLIITAAGQLKVTDFGIARIESAALTQVTSTIGTPGYMAPEQYVGESFDHRVDLFAAGVLLYRMLTGQPPFTGTAESVMYAIMNKDPAPLSESLDADRAAFYQPVVSGALAKEAQRRFASAAAFRAALLDRKNVQAASAAETTIIVQSAHGADERSATRPGSARSATPTTKQTALTGWDDADLAPVQTALARFMGPMAKVLVRQAAKQCTDLPSLINRLAQDIAGADDQSRFLALMQRHANTGTLGSGAGATRVNPTGGTSAEPQTLSPAIIEHASLVMARHMGPIAKIIVKKAASKASSPTQFVALLAQEMPDGPQRAQLITEFQTQLDVHATQR